MCTILALYHLRPYGAHQKMDNRSGDYLSEAKELSSVIQIRQNITGVVEKSQTTTEETNQQAQAPPYTQRTTKIAVGRRRRPKRNMFSKNKFKTQRYPPKHSNFTSAP